jgi:hypothetical protein
MGVSRYYVQAMRPSGRRSRPIKNARRLTHFLGRKQHGTRFHPHHEVHHERTACRPARQSLYRARLVHYRYP